MNQYPVPAADVMSKEEIKKSRFITYLAHTPGIEAAQAYIQKIKNEHAAARHNCWAFVAGAPDDSMSLGFSDDGEPSGTAGKPILAQLQGSGIGEITAVVTRYSGGIKLGTGGLVSAYGGGVHHALGMLQTFIKVNRTTLGLEFNYPQQKEVERLLKQFETTILSANYQHNITLTVEIASTDVSDFIAKLNAYGKGKIQISTEK